MNFNEYQVLTRRTRSAACTASLEALMLNGILGAGGESGELLDMLKKSMFQGHELVEEDVVKEVGDILWYLAEIMDALGQPLEVAATRNIEKLKKRYPDGFSVEASLNREE